MELFHTFYCITQHDDIVSQKGTSSSEGAFCYEAVSPIAKHKQCTSYHKASPHIECASHNEAVS